MPERFNLTFINEKGEEERPVVIHRSSVGAIERTMAFLIEKYGGAFPVWLSPVQVKVLPITDRNLKYAQDIADKLKNAQVRVEVDDRNETLQAKIRDAELEKVPYMLILGGKEEEAKKVSIRARGEKGDLGQMETEKFASLVKEKITSKSLDL